MTLYCRVLFLAQQIKELENMRSQTSFISTQPQPPYNIPTPNRMTPSHTTPNHTTPSHNASSQATPHATPTHVTPTHGTFEHVNDDMQNSDEEVSEGELEETFCDTTADAEVSQKLSSGSDGQDKSPAERSIPDNNRMHDDLSGDELDGSLEDYDASCMNQLANVAAADDSSLDRSGEKRDLDPGYSEWSDSDSERQGVPLNSSMDVEEGQLSDGGGHHKDGPEAGELPDSNDEDQEEGEVSPGSSSDHYRDDRP